MFLHSSLSLPLLLGLLRRKRPAAVGEEAHGGTGGPVVSGIIAPKGKKKKKTKAHDFLCAADSGGRALVADV